MTVEIRKRRNESTTLFIYFPAAQKFVVKYEELRFGSMLSPNFLYGATDMFVLKIYIYVDNNIFPACLFTLYQNVEYKVYYIQ